MSLVLLLFYMQSCYDCHFKLMHSLSVSIPVLHDLCLLLHNVVTADIVNL